MYAFSFSFTLDSLTAVSEEGAVLYLLLLLLNKQTLAQRRILLLTTAADLLTAIRGVLQRHCRPMFRCSVHSFNMRDGVILVSTHYWGLCCMCALS